LALGQLTLGRGRALAWRSSGDSTVSTQRLASENRTMGKEKNATASPLLRELFQVGIYKASQGRIARRATFATLMVVLLLGAWRLSVYMLSAGRAMQFVPSAVLVVVGSWLAFRLVNLPAFADFLIAVEAEMNKVSWPTRRELVRSSIVVICCIFFLAFVLFGYDLFWRQLLELLGIASTTTPVQ
jgi:preprotein translocase subunit SecE